VIVGTEGTTTSMLEMLENIADLETEIKNTEEALRERDVKMEDSEYQVG
jgi:hypothetical protein